MGIESLLNRVRKAIKRIEDRETASTVHICDVDTKLDDLSGLIIILHPDFLKEQATTPNQTT